MNCVQDERGDCAGKRVWEDGLKIVTGTVEERTDWRR